MKPEQLDKLQDKQLTVAVDDCDPENWTVYGQKPHDMDRETRGNAIYDRKLAWQTLDEQTHILVPNGKKLFICTPHTYDSLYDRIERMGAYCLTIKMFEKEHRISQEEAIKKNISTPF